MSGGKVKTGDCISIFWDGDQKWYYGQILSYDEASQTCEVLYDDGEKENVNLNTEKFKIHSKKESARKALPAVSSANNQWKFLEKTVFDIADRLPYKGVHAAKENWWEKWKVKVASAIVSKNVASMSFSLIEISRQLKANVTTDWWKTEKRAWEKEVVDAKNSRQLAFRVNELLTKAIDWARARQLFDNPSSQKGNLMESVSKLEPFKADAIAMEITGEDDTALLDKADSPASPDSNVRRTRRNRVQEVSIQSRSSKRLRQTTSDDAGIPGVQSEVITQKQEGLTEVVPCKSSAEDYEDKNPDVVSNVESVGVEHGDNISYKSSHSDAPVQGSLQVAVDSLLQPDTVLIQNIDNGAQKRDPSETSVLHPELYRQGEMQTQLNKKIPGVSNLQDQAKIPQELPGYNLQNSIPKEMFEFMKSRYDQDKDFTKAYKSIVLTGKKATGLPNCDYSINDGFLYFQNRLCIVLDEDFRQKLIQECHISSGEEHLDSHVTSQLLETSFFWPKMHKDVQQYVGSCATCLDPHEQATENQNLFDPEVPDKPWQSVFLTFINEVPCSSEGHTCILTLVDRTSKLAHFVACKKTFTAIEMAHIYFTDIVRLHGFPKLILSDDQSLFQSDFWTSMWKIFGVTLDYTSTQCAGKNSDIGQVSKLLESLLRSYVASQQQQWQENLHLVEFAYNNSISTSTSTESSPFKSFYGYDFSVPSPLPVPTTQKDGASEFVTTTMNLLSVINTNLSQLTENREITVGLSNAHENIQNGEQPFPSKDVKASNQPARKRKNSRFSKT